MRAETLRDFGDLAPIRDVAAWLEGRIDADRGFRPDDDPALIAMREAKKRLDDALADAVNADLDLTVEQAAEMEGISVEALYKRIQRGRVAVRRRGGRVRIPLRSAA